MAMTSTHSAIGTYVDHLKQCSNLEQEWHYWGLSDRPKSVRRCIQNTLGLRMRSGRRCVGHRDLLATVMGKNRRPGTGSLDHAKSNQHTGPRAGSWVQPRKVQPGILIASFRNQPGRLCSVLRWVRMSTLRIRTMPLEQAHGRRGLLTRGAQQALWDPSAGALRGCASLGKLEQRQGLLIPWYHEDRDCDYLRVPRLAVAPAASAASPSSDPESFAVTLSA